MFQTRVMLSSFKIYDVSSGPRKHSNSLYITLWPHPAKVYIVINWE